MNPKDKVGKSKPSLSLVPSTAVIYLSEAFKEGAEKYGAYNWRESKVETLTYINAILRHLYAYLDGEDIDPESNKPHLAGVLASVAILLDAKENNTLIDNRPSKGNAGELLRKLTKIAPGYYDSLDKGIVFGENNKLLSKHSDFGIDDSKCLTMEEHRKKAEDLKDPYGKRYLK